MSVLCFLHCPQTIVHGRRVWVPHSALLPLFQGWEDLWEECKFALCTFISPEWCCLWEECKFMFCTSSIALGWWFLWEVCVYALHFLHCPLACGSYEKNVGPSSALPPLSWDSGTCNKSVNLCSVFLPLPWDSGALQEECKSEICASSIVSRMVEPVKRVWVHTFHFLHFVWNGDVCMSYVTHTFGSWTNQKPKIQGKSGSLSTCAHTKLWRAK